MRKNEAYRIKFEKNGFYTREVFFNTNQPDSNLTNLYNSPIILSKIHYEPIRLENIYFEFDEYQLSDQSRAYIDSSLYKVLRLNPELQIEISAHTDHIGSEAYNMNLSQKRAESVANYLQQKGIEAERLIPAGYGMSKPIVVPPSGSDEDCAEIRQLNRRVEFKVIEPSEKTEIHALGGY